KTAYDTGFLETGTVGVFDMDSDTYSGHFITVQDAYINKDTGEAMIDVIEGHSFNKDTEIIKGMTLEAINKKYGWMEFAGWGEFGKNSDSQILPEDVSEGLGF
ncbi:MAG: hypothetical protein PQJ46_10395, partial [Spirochaetales bacterium]|nr:hypothetical protein [Spirochaetales bacterium]